MSVTMPCVYLRLVFNKANASKTVKAWSEFIRLDDPQGLQLDMIRFRRKYPLKL
mgnify:FL=1